MHDARVVGGSQRPANLPHDAYRVRDGQLAGALEVLSELLPAQKLRNDVRLAVGRHVHVVHVEHVRVGDAARRFRLALKPRHDFGLAREIRIEKLHGEALAGEPRVARLVDATHAAFPEHAHHLVRLGKHLPKQRIFTLGRVLERDRVARAHAEVRGKPAFAGGAAPAVQ